MSEPFEIQKMTGVTIRRLNGADAADVSRLVQLDSADPPAGALLGAEIEGRLVAVVAVDDGKVIADPFSRSSELGALLELRAGQLRGREPERRGRFRGLFARRRQRPAPSAPTPPGAGARLVGEPLRHY
jgi:hypothetical protein